MASLAPSRYNGSVEKLSKRSTNGVKAMIEQNVLPFKLELTDEELTPHAGLIVAHEFHLGLGLDRLVDEHLPSPGSNHPQTVGKLERLHRTMKEHVNVHVYPHPWELERAIDGFYRFYNYERYHESLANVTPADVYFGRAEAVLRRRKAIQARTKQERRARYEAWKMEQAALTADGSEGTLSVGLSEESASSQEATNVSH